MKKSLSGILKGKIYSFSISQKGKRWVYFGKIFEITSEELFLEDTRLREFNELYKGLINAPKVGFQVLKRKDIEVFSHYS